MEHGPVPLYDIVGVAVIGEHRVRLLFEDGTVGDVSYVGREWKGVFAPLADPAVFAKVTVEHGTLYWSEYDLDVAPEPLYEAARANALVPGITTPLLPQPSWLKGQRWLRRCTNGCLLAIAMRVPSRW